MKSILVERPAAMVRISPEMQREAVEKFLPDIQRYANTEVRAEDVLVRGAYIVNSARDFYYSRFSDSSLGEVAELIPGRPVQAAHTYSGGIAGLPHARFFHANVVERDMPGWPKRDSKWVEALWYTANDDAGKALVRRVDLGIYQESSLGWRCAAADCSVCGDDIRECGHVPGEVYERSGLCEFRFGGIIGVLEGSIVFSGGQKSTSMFNPTRSKDDGRQNEFDCWDRIAEAKQAPGDEFDFLRSEVASTVTIEAMLRGRAEPGLRRSLVAVECARSRFGDEGMAARWVREHGFRADKRVAGADSWRFTQKNAGGVERAIQLDEGVFGVMLKEREKRSESDDSLESLLSK